MPTGISVTSICPANSYLCPASMGGGCCRSGLSCGVTTCYETTSTTSVTLTLTLTTTNSNSVINTITTVLETVYNPPTPTSGPASPLPTPIAKLPSSQSNNTTPVISPSSSGITAKELGGIVGACVFLLLALLIATYLILRRLNLTIKLTKDGLPTNRSGQPNTASTRNISVGIDPLRQVPSSRTGTQSHQPMTNQTTPSELSDNTPVHAAWGRQPNLSSSREPPFVAFSPLNWPAREPYRPGQADGSSVTNGQYRSLPSSDTGRHWRTDSESSQPQSISQPTTASINAYAAELPSPDPPQGYFDIPVPRTASAMAANVDPALRDQNLRFGHTVSMIQSSDEVTRGGHGRQWSDVSELSNGTETTNESYELDETSPKSSYYGNKSGYGSLLYSKANQSGERSLLREGVKNKVQDWVGMTGIGRKPSSRRNEDGSGPGPSISRLSGRLKPMSPTMTSSPPPMSKNSAIASSLHDQVQWLGSMERPLATFGRFGDKGRLEAIREAFRESGTTFNSTNNARLDDDTGAGEVSESRAQIARMELKRVDSDMTDLTRSGRVDVAGGGEGGEYSKEDTS